MLACSSGPVEDVFNDSEENSSETATANTEAVQQQLADDFDSMVKDSYDPGPTLASENSYYVDKTESYGLARKNWGSFLCG